MIAKGHLCICSLIPENWSCGLRGSKNLTMQLRHLKSDDIVIKDKNVVCRYLDERAILLNNGYGHPFRLNKMGTRIWKLLDHHSRVEDLIENVYGFYQVDRNEAAPDTISFLSQLIDKKLLKKG